MSFLRHLLPLVVAIAAGVSSIAQSPANLGVPASDDGLPGAGPIRRADWFKNHWLQRRQKWAERRELDRHSLVFVGDSITEGWGDRPADGFGSLKVSNRGISGDTSRGVLVRLREDVLDLDPVGVFAQRTKYRPNPLAVTAVHLLGIDGNVVRVRGLDALDGTPVLDIKPYMPPFDRMEDVKMPSWVSHFIEGYF
jgi:hypothetical protein